VRVRFHGHACFSVLQGASHVLVDPFEPSGLHGAVQLRRPPVVPTHLICTHQHSDHSAVQLFPTATIVTPGFSNEDVQIDGLTVHHDMHEGRLRGGHSTVLRIRSTDACLIHLGDIGERLTCSQIAWLREVTPDLLIVPAGGWYTLDSGGALELIRLIQPASAWVCHTSDDGVKLLAMEDRQTLVRLWGGTEPQTVTEWDVAAESRSSQTHLLFGSVPH
jgi:L-ascorbate metabolism protein UlaG (beta-lactamase superfamily)